MAGEGKRFKNTLPKPLVSLNGKPLFLYALEVFEASPLIKSIVVVVPPSHLKDFKETVSRQGLKKIAHIVAGGKTRRDSVFNGLKVLDKDTEAVVVHDGVRPLVTGELLAQVVEQLKRHQAVIVAVPVKPTIKKVDPGKMQVAETIQRENVWEVQTPQAFHKETLLKAHREAQGSATDDAVMVEALGVPVSVVMGDYRNLKITTPEDLIMAQALLSSGKKKK